MANKIAQIKQKLIMARKHAYLSKYTQAQTLFKNIIETVQQQLVLNDNQNKKLSEEWKKMLVKIKQQKQVVQNMISMLNGIKNSRCSFTQDTFESSNQFQQHNRKTNSSFKGNRRNPSIRENQKRSQKKIFNNDPFVWDTPNKLERPVGNSIRKPQKNVTCYPNSSQLRSNIQARKGPVSLKQKKETEKKTFMQDRYPNGSGPDSNLIQMLQRQVLDKSPKINFDDIADLQTAKGLLQQAVLLPLKMPQFFTGIRRAWRGVLMFGPPGTGKTLLAKAVASTGSTTFFNVSASSLASKWKGQSQKLVRILFQMAKFYAPSVIFIDQIDAVGGRRKEGEDQSNRKVKTQLLVQMDGATSSDNTENKFVIVLAATNRPWDLDQALRRRLEKRIYIPLPTPKGRQQLVKINLKNVKLNENIDMQYIIKKTEGFSGADITNVCRQAAYQPMRRKLKAQGGFKNIIDLKKFQQEVDIPLTKQDFLEALKNVNKSVGQQDLKKYENWMKQFGSQ